jgi:hypothetical protein
LKRKRKRKLQGTYTDLTATAPAFVDGLDEVGAAGSDDLRTKLGLGEVGRSKQSVERSKLSVADVERSKVSATEVERTKAAVGDVDRSNPSIAGVDRSNFNVGSVDRSNSSAGCVDRPKDVVVRPRQCLSASNSNSSFSSTSTAPFSRDAAGCRPPPPRLAPPANAATRRLAADSTDLEEVCT